MIAAFLGGFWPGMIATLLSSLLCSFFLLSPIYSFRVEQPEQFFRLSLFVLEGTLISALSAALNSSRRKVLHHPVLRYGIAASAVAVTLLMKMSVRSLVGADVPFTLFSAAVMVSAWVGGFGPGIFATLLSVLAADYFFLAPIHSFHVDSFPHILRLVLFILEGFLITYFSTFVFEQRQRTESLEQEAKKSELALRNSERRFRLMVDGVRDYAIYMLDIGGNVISWNSGAERMEGHKASEAIEKPFSAFYTEEDRANGLPQAELQKAQEEGISHNTVWRTRKDGNRFMAETSITAIMNEEEKLEGFSVVIHDITERMESEEALRRSEDRSFC